MKNRSPKDKSRDQSFRTVEVGSGGGDIWNDGSADEQVKAWPKKVPRPRVQQSSEGMGGLVFAVAISFEIALSLPRKSKQRSRHPIGVGRKNTTLPKTEQRRGRPLLLSSPCRLPGK